MTAHDIHTTITESLSQLSLRTERPPEAEGHHDIDLISSGSQKPLTPPK
jgi:hypothetical protein